MLQGICHLRPTHQHWEGPEDVPFTHIVRNTFMRGSLASLKISAIALLGGPNLTVKTAVSELGKPRRVRPKGGTQLPRQGGHGCCNRQ